MKHIRSSHVIAFGFALSVGSLWAQGTLHDPTRPPSNVSASVAAAMAAVPEGSSLNAEAQKPSGERIQMLLIGRHRSFAMIDGVVVKLGESLNQWQLVSIDRQSVVMRNAAVTEEISINPSVVKTARSTNRSGNSIDSIDNKPSRKSP